MNGILLSKFPWKSFVFPGSYCVGCNIIQFYAKYFIQLFHTCYLISSSQQHFEKDLVQLRKPKLRGYSSDLLKVTSQFVAGVEPEPRSSDGCPSCYTLAVSSSFVLVTVTTGPLGPVWTDLILSTEWLRVVFQRQCAKEVASHVARTCAEEKILTWNDTGTKDSPPPWNQRTGTWLELESRILTRSEGSSV